MSSLVEIREELNAKRKELHEVWEQAGPDRDFERVTLLGQGTTEQKVAEFRRRSTIIDDLAKEEAQYALAEQIATRNEREYKLANEPLESMQHPSAGGGGQVKAFKPGDIKRTLQESRDYKRFKDAGGKGSAQIELPNVDFKTLITLQGINRQATRLPTQDMALETRTVSDLMMNSTIDGNTIDYYEETTFTNNADTINRTDMDATGGSAPESALGWTLRTKYVSDIAHFIPATKDSLMDLSFLEGQIRGRLAYGVIRREEAQLLKGDGVAPNLLGILNAGVQTQAKGSDPVPDAIYKAMQKVRGAAGTGFSEPSAVVMHPNDWTDIRLLRTVDGVYIWGSPSEPGADRIWGLPVRQTTEMTENTALVGAFSTQAEVMRREGITVTLSTEHSTYFVDRKVAILGEERILLAIYRPTAFCTATGI